MKTCRKQLHTYSDELDGCPQCWKSNIQKWVTANKQKVRDKNRNWKRLHRDRKRHNDEQLAWQKSNPGKANARSKKYQAAKINRTPPWLTKEHLSQIEEFYQLAQDLAWLNQDGKAFEVDHIIPLQGKEVSGLHVPWNLQLLTKKENRTKSNNLTKDLLNGK